MLKAPPGLPTAPSAEATVQLKPMLISWRVAVRSLLPVQVAISDPTHGSAAKEKGGGGQLKPPPVAAATPKPTPDEPVTAAL